MWSLYASIYRVGVGLTPVQLVIAGTILEATVFLAEVPTGIVADMLSRRLSVIIGYFIIGLGFLLEGLFPIVWVVLLAQAVWGFGYTFISGAQEVWIVDELAPCLRRGDVCLRKGL
ncbi:MAG: hypothetical protein AAF633_12890 [Chloroflexota bacterium]